MYAVVASGHSAKTVYTGFDTREAAERWAEENLSGFLWEVAQRIHINKPSTMNVED